MKIDYPRAGRRGPFKLLPSWRQLLVLALLGVAAVVGLFAVAYATIDVPAQNQQTLAARSTVYYRDGKTVIGSYGDTNRTFVTLDQVAPDVRTAVEAAEDRTFETNRGISPRGVARAFVNNMRNNPTQGGSTITQQYVKNVYLNRDRTLTRKLKEFVISVKISRQQSKELVLQQYLNTIYWGRGAYGVQAAAQAWFGVDASRLDTAQSAFLAGIIASPSRLDPREHAAQAQARWRYVLDGMVTMGNLTPAKRAALAFPTVTVPTEANRLGGPKGYLLAVVKAELARDGFDEDDVDAGGLTITTTFTRKAQAAAEKAVRANFPKSRAAQVHAGLASVVPGSGEVAALYGGADYVKAPGQDAALAKVQGGSTFKAFTLAAALQDGISLDSRFSGTSPFRIPGSSKGVRNEFGTSYGSSVSLRTATAKSINTAFVDLTVTLGPDRVREAAVDAGLAQDTPGLNANPVITLGTASVDALTMANAYATFAAGGVRAVPHTVLRVQGGDRTYEAKKDTERAFSADVAADVTDALRGVVTSSGGTGRGAQVVGRPVAGKTGTATNADRDVISAWFVGYAPQLATAVSFYNGDGTKSLDGVGGEGNSTFFGGGFPLTIWSAYMKAALKGSAEQDFPDPAHVGRVRGRSSDARPSSTSTPTSSSTATATPSLSPTPTVTPPPVTVTPTAPPASTPPVVPTEVAPTTAAPTVAPTEVPSAAATSPPAAAPVTP